MKAKINAGLTLSKASLLFGFVFGASLAFANPGETTDPNQTALVEPTAESDLALPRELPELEPLLAHPRTSMVIVEQLRRNHYVTKAINDDLSSVVLDNYLKALDGGRYYFLATDVSEFEAYRYKLDDTLKKGDLDPAFTIFNRFQTRVSERLHYLLALIDGGLETLDFEQDEYIEVDRAAAAWPIDLPAQNELWRRRLKAQVLNMTLGDKTLDEIATTLEKRYRNQLKIAMRNRSEDAFQTFMNAFASSFDPHTQYFSPRSSENFNINMSLSLEGIGAVLQTEEDATSVVRLVPAGPADKSGQIKPSDKIIEVGQGTDGPMIDVVGWRLDDVVELIRGPKGSTVRLTVVSGGAEDKESTVVTIERNTIKLEEQAAQAKVITLQDGTEQRRIGVLQIPTFYADFEAQQRGDRDYRSTTRDARRLISELKQTGIDGLIVDLRSNGGGSLQEADSLTGLFLESGPTVQVKTARRRPSVYKNGSSDLVWDGPMAVMVN
ncbi:MAG TPA: tail-specific protease, partial [Gammaproteobacteria bacterium]|nr:tail-specific protease [Gammaproteobacteria bacterium]